MGMAEEKLKNLKVRMVTAGYRVEWFDTPMEMADKMEADIRR
jgi:hypothetical protein